MKPRAKLLQPVTAAVNYEDMFKTLLSLASNEQQATTKIRPMVQKEIAWAKKTFSNNSDWISWWLRWYRLIQEHFWDYVGYEITSKDLQAYNRKADTSVTLEDLNGMAIHLQSIHSELEHLVSLAAPSIKTYQPGYKLIREVITDLKALEKEWQESRKGIIDPQEGDEIIIQFPDGWAWWLLPRESCTEEGKAMGHCGNAAGATGDRLLSLRKKKAQDWHVSLTFVVRENGYLWEMKGRSNTKPAAKYHPYIVKLLENDIVKGIDATGVHAPEENFEMTDLTEEEQEKLYAVKPTLLPLSLYFQKFGADEHFTTSILEYLNNKSNSTWTWDGQEFVGPTWDSLEDLAGDIGGRGVDRLLDYYNGNEQPEFGNISEKDMLDYLPNDQIEKIGVTLKAKYADQIQDWIETQDDYDPDDDESDYYFDTTDEKEIVSLAEMVGDSLIDALHTAGQTGYEASFQKEVSRALESWAEDAGFSPPDSKHETWYRGITPRDALALKEEEGDPDEIDSDRGSLNNWDSSGDFDSKAAIEAFRDYYNVDKELTEALGEDGVKAFHEKKATAKRYKEEYRRVIDDLRAALKESTPEERERIKELDAGFKDGEYAPFVEWARTIVPDAFTFPEPEAEPKTSGLQRPRAKLLQKQAAADYEAMFAPLLKYVGEQDALPQDEKSLGPRLSVVKHNVTTQINWAKRTFQNNNAWIMWWLRWYRCTLDRQYAPDLFAKDFSFQVKDPSIKSSDVLTQSQMGYHGDKLQHYMGTPCPAIQKYRPEYKPIEWVEHDLDKLEKEWKETRRGLITPQEDDTIIIQFPDKWAWWLLPRESCEAEGDAMGHCGNSGDPQEGDRVLSLRRLKGKEWFSSLTFILRQDGLLSEMKGRGNEKPVAKYFPYIVRLLEDDLVKGIIGGGYEPEHNFDMNDLPEDERKRLYKEKPTLMAPQAYYEQFGADGHIVGLLDDWFHAKNFSREPQWDAHLRKFVSAGEDTWSDIYALVEDKGDSSADRLLEVASWVQGESYDFNMHVMAILEHAAHEAGYMNIGDEWRFTFRVTPEMISEFVNGDDPNDLNLNDTIHIDKAVVKQLEEDVHEANEELSQEENEEDHND